MWNGKPVCRVAFREAIQLSNKKLTKFEKAISAGMLQPYEDQRQYNGSSERNLSKLLDVDAFFSFVYQYLAEPLADEDRGCEELRQKGHHEYILEWIQARDGNPLASASAGMQQPVDRRYLPWMSWVEFYELYQCHNMEKESDGALASIKSFRKTFTDKWDAMLGFRAVGQHDRCDTCVELTKIRREHPEAKERELAAKAYKQHLNRMFDDRRLDARLTHLSELSVSTTSSISSVIHIRIDGMDQAKFKVPRNMESSKLWSKAWRPTLHTVGVVVEGLLEIVLIMPADEKKGSNMEISCLSYALDLAHKELNSKGLRMPDHLSVTYDNTGREGKNQFVCQWLAWLVLTGKFRSTQDGQGEKGHTHNKLDQRFSVISTILKRTPVMQTPQDMMVVGSSLVLKKYSLVWA